MSAADVHSINRIRLRVVGVVLGGLVLTAAASHWLASVERRANDILFQQEANERFDALAEGIHDAGHALDIVNRLFYTLEDVSREQFVVFVEPLLKKYPYVLSFTYQRIMPDPRRAAYEAGMQGIYPGFRIRELRNGRLIPSSVKPVYRVVDYIVPLAGNEDALGVDASSIAEQEIAAVRAAKSGKIEASGLFHLVRDGGKHTGFMMVKRVCRRAPVGPPEGTACNVNGYTAAVFNIRDFLHKILEQGGFLKRQDYQIELFAGNQASRGSRLYAFPLHTGSNQSASALQAEHSLARTFDFAGMSMNMVVTSSAREKAATLSASALSMIFGIVLTAMLAMHIRSTSYRALSLKKANEALQQDIALREEVQRALLQSQAELRELAKHQQQVREDERKHIAREIHDDLGQNLLVLRMDVTLARQGLQDKCPEAIVGMESLLGQIDTTVRSVRQIINRLRPAVLDLGPMEAIKWLVNQMNKPGKVCFVLECADEEVLAGLNEEQAVTLFRIVQEATANVLRHANASNARIEIGRSETHIHVAIIDDGSGAFPADRRKSRSFGIIGIKERVAAEGGQFRLRAEPGKGTTITFTLPVHSVKTSTIEAA